MTRGRKRKHNPAIPAHVDQTSLPRGIYFDASGKGRWYVREEHPEGRTRTVTVAGPRARLSELHDIMERRAGGSTKGTVSYVLEHFHESVAFRDLAPRTQRDYQRYRDHLEELPTKAGGKFGQMTVDRLSPPVIQRLVEVTAAKGHRTKANHWLRYLRRCFRWGINHGKCLTNPAAGVQEVSVKPQVRVPDIQTYNRVLEFARARGARQTRTAGSCPPYLWICMELAYLCRLRGVEVITLTDANITEAGLVTNRRKGSNDGLMAWSPRLRAAVDAARELRKAAHERTGRPVFLKPSERTLIVAEDADALRKSSLDSAWQRLMHAAIAPPEKGGIITPEERFGLHAMKHRGITDTVGNKSDKQTAGGHRSARMTDVYDHELPVVAPPRGAEFSGEFSGGGDSEGSGIA
ncbi:site-specific integrase [Marilutibacter aestuarii]|uniref:Integrase n=1 Tax=Marilutibacter aestuarii TaxID=1706195 RepID=A0A508AZ95_9GAMM|nr:integrase [Lysobacter aestuarii]TQD51202.1 integrase [Lysobacter aestuarii]